MKIRLIETLASGAPFVVPVLLRRLDALHKDPAGAHTLSAFGATVKIALRGGEHVGEPADGANIDLQASRELRRFRSSTVPCASSPSIRFRRASCCRETTACRSAWSGRWPTGRSSPAPRSAACVRCWPKSAPRSRRPCYGARTAVSPPSSPGRRGPECRSRAGCSPRRCRERSAADRAGRACR